MRTAILYRMEKSETETIGTYILDGKVFCVTLENTKKLIPCGTYECKFEYSNKFERELYELKGVPGMTETKHHIGNTAEDSNGCILMGTQAGYFDNRRAVLASGNTIERFHDMMNGENLLLSICDLTSLS